MKFREFIMIAGSLEIVDWRSFGKEFFITVIVGSDTDQCRARSVWRERDAIWFETIGEFRNAINIDEDSVAEAEAWMEEQEILRCLN